MSTVIAHLNRSLCGGLVALFALSACEPEAGEDPADAAAADVRADLGASADAEAEDVETSDAASVDLGAADLGRRDLGTLADAGSVPDAGSVLDAGSVPDAGSTNTAPPQMQGLLDLMNAARLATGSAPLTWNAGVAATAATWAEGCQWMHAPANQRIYMGTQMGENLSAGSGTSWNPTSLGQGWIDERVDWDCAANTCAAGEVCGHYTQVIWRNSTEVGCALRTCTTGSPLGSSTWQFLVCRYLPAGNYNNQRPIPAADCP